MTSVRATKTHTPIKGTQITGEDWLAVHGPNQQVNSTQTVLTFKDEGQVPRALPDGSDLNSVNTANLIFPANVEDQGVVDASVNNYPVNGTRSRANTFPQRAGAADAVSVDSSGSGLAPLRDAQFENNVKNRQGLIVPPLSTGWWRDPSETKNMVKNEIVITQHHGLNINPLVEAISTIAHGDMPYNFQMIQTIDNLLLALQTERTLSGLKMSPKGQQISLSFEDVLVKTRSFILNKNHDEKLQQLFDHAKKSALQAKSAALTFATPQMRQQLEPDALLKLEAQSSIARARLLVNDILVSAEFRSLLVELLKTLNEVFARTLKPKQQKLKKGVEGMLDNFERGATMSDLSKQMRDVVKAEAPVQTQTTVLVVDGQPAVIQTQVPQVKVSNLTPEERERLAKRLRTVLARFGENPHFRKSANSLYKLINDALHRTTGAMATEQGGSLRNMHKTDEVQLAWADLQEVLERFTSGYKVENLVKNCENLVALMRTDVEARLWLRELNSYSKFLWSNPQHIEDDASVRGSQALIDRARDILTSERYHAITEAILNESKTILKAIKHDPDRVALADAFGQLADDMFFANGVPSLYVFQETAAQLRYLLVPLISKQLENIQVPQIEGYTPKYDFAARNLIFSGAEILPQNITLNIETGVNLALDEAGTSYTRSHIQVIISGVKMHVKNIDFYYLRKSFPKLTDQGRMGIDFGGDGISILLEWFADLTEGHEFKIVCSRAVCGIDKVDISLDAHRSKFMGTVALGIFKNRIRKSLEKVFAENLMQIGYRGAKGINDLFSERRQNRNLRLKTEAIKRETRAQRRLEKEAQRKAKEMIREENKTIAEFAPQLLQPVAPPVVYTTVAAPSDGVPVPFSQPISVVNLPPQPSSQVLATHEEAAALVAQPAVHPVVVQPVVQPVIVPATATATTSSTATI